MYLKKEKIMKRIIQIIPITCMMVLAAFTACNTKNKNTTESHAENKNVDYKTISFYYNWYGNIPTDGENLHWQHGIAPAPGQKGDAGSIPGTEDNIACNYYPQLGLYSSNDRETIKKHIQMHVQARVGVLSVTWWGEHDFKHPSIPILLDEAQKAGLKICFHIEPYPNRNARTFSENVKYIIDNFGEHPAFYKVDGKPMFFVYDSYLIKNEEWVKVFSKEGELSVRGTKYDGIYIGLALKKESLNDIYQSHFDGFYTYFASTGFTEATDPHNWKFMQEWGEKHNKIFIPSVGPGYIDTRIRPWNTSTTRDRETGKYYDDMYKAAIDCNAPYISITSFNEWHEGTQIEPAVPYKGNAFEYLDYKPLDTDYYLEKTAYWVKEFQESKK